MSGLPPLLAQSNSSRSVFSIFRLKEKKTFKFLFVPEAAGKIIVKEKNDRTLQNQYGPNYC